MALRTQSSNKELITANLVLFERPFIGHADEFHFAFAPRFGLHSRPA
jgi:hypothetical protein